MRILSILFLFTNLLAFAQPRSFSKQPNVFIEELNQYLSTGVSLQSSPIQKLFTEKWNAGLYPEDEQRIIIKVCNEMLLNKLTIPDFLLLEETVLAGKDSLDVEKYDNWMKALYPAVQSDNKTYLTLLKASRNLFIYNRLYQSETKSWYSSKNSFVFSFEDKRVKISFKNIDLLCKAQADHIMIYNTSGSYYLDKEEWEGYKGRLTWERVGFGKDNIYADIQGKYELRFDRAEIEVDSVLYTNIDFLSDPVLGSFHDRASSAEQIEEGRLLESAFPQFNSYRKDIKLGTYLDGQVHFRGGFAMKGREIISQGVTSDPAVIEIEYKDQTRLIAKSNYYSLRENKITSLQTEITIYTDSGEIFHPRIQFNLNFENKLLLLTRGKDGLQQAPFFNTDHGVEIYVDRVLWNLEQPTIEFDMAVNDAAAIVESSDFYKEVRYEKIPRGMLAYHPLSKMRDFVIKFRKRDFSFTEYASWMGSKQVNLKPQIMELADLGYIFFNPETDTIKVRKKLDHAVLSHMKLVDYDVIRFSSVIAARSNSFYNLINNTFVLEGVQAFRFSDSQSVYAFPSEQKVILKSKKRMSFGGRVTAGKFDFYASDFEFDYHDFTINSDQIDSMRIYTEDFEGKNRLVAVKSVLRDINGTLEIDKSNNKSGLTDYPEYPIFTSRKGSKIAYDKPTLYNGAYTKDEFHFLVDPFTIDSLDNFTTKGLKFPGTFVSAGIIPEFRYEAGIMDDYSLGFERANPPGGYPMYGGIGHGDIDIKLSEEGFQAKGNIQFQGAEISSQDIVMMPDSTLAAAESYTINEDHRYPNVFAKDVLTRWLPKKDSLFVNTQEHDVQVLRDRQNFNGNLVQTSKQLSGDGLLSWETAKLSSEDMKFKPNEVDALKSKIEIGAISGDKIAFASYNVKSHVDFNTRIGEFKANEQGQLTDFPFNAYASSMDEYTWDMDAQTIELNKGPLLTKEKSIFVSKHPDQQGLKFQSDKALFDMKAGVIYAENVPYIDVADSRVFPFEEKVTLEENALMRPLEQSKLLAARDNKFHKIHDAKLFILGRYNLNGSGHYEYKDKNKTGQIIFFDKINVTGDSTVKAEGYIRDSINFNVSPKIAYKGYVYLSSIEEKLKFNGYVKPLHSFELYSSNWFRYEQQPDPLNVIIPAYNPINEDRRKLSVSVNIANDSTHIYPSFFTFKRSYADLELTKDTGVLYYNEAESTFYVGDSAKLFDEASKGSYLSFNDATGEIHSEGRIDFGLDVDEHFNGISAGTIHKSLNDSVFTVEALLALNLELPSECYTRMIEVIRANSGGIAEADHYNDFTRNAVSELTDSKKLPKVLEELDMGQITSDELIKRNLLISHMRIYYSKTLDAFISTDPIQIATINGQQINTQVNSRMVMTRKRSGTRITLYIEVSKYDWFYIDYYLGSLNVASTDKSFNDIIFDKGPKLSKGRFRIRTASPRTVNNFLEKLE